MKRINIELATNKNSDYRHVLYTTPNMQIVVMSLIPGQEIGKEKHRDTTQFFRVESGNGYAISGNQKILLGPGVSVTVPPNTFHNIIAGKKGLKLYTIYSPPKHPDGLIEKFKVD
jgi:mannose-6-phosphate isomerase-like protein (cupin superfamily)